MSEQLKVKAEIRVQINSRYEKTSVSTMKRAD